MVKVAESSQGKYFGIADHNTEVIITDGGVLKSSRGSEYIQLEFEADGKEGDTGYNNYITEKALPYTADRVQAILVHNQETDAQKEAVRKAIIDLPDAQFGEWAVEQLKGKKAFLHVSYSDNINPKSGKPYLEFNIAGWEATAPQEPKATVESLMGGGTPVDTKEVPFL